MIIKYDPVQGVGYVLTDSPRRATGWNMTKTDGFDENQPRDSSGRWTGGGDPSKAGTHPEKGTPLRPRKFELTTASETHTFSDFEGDKDTYSFSPNDAWLDLPEVRDAESLDRLKYSVIETRNAPAGYAFAKLKIGPGVRGEKTISRVYEHKETGREHLEHVGTYREIRPSARKLNR